MNKKKLFTAIGVGFVALCGLADVDVCKPAIKPTWSGAKVATWTMDYKTALAKASAEGKYTLMFFSGMWWCPHCQHLEENVLTTAEWKAFAKGNGFYETVIDFPNRAGDGYWCWLWEDSYRKSARLTAEEATEAIIERYNLQNYYALPGGTRQIARNVVVEMVGKGPAAELVVRDYVPQPTSEYTRIGYPTILVIDPDGHVLGRFSPSKGNTAYTSEPLQWVKNQINAILYPNVGEKIDEIGQYAGFAVVGGETVGAVTIKTGRPNKDTNLAVAQVVLDVYGKKTTLKGNIYSAENATSTFVSKTGDRVVLRLDGKNRVIGTFGEDIKFIAYKDAWSANDAEGIGRIESLQGIWSLVVSGKYTEESGCVSCGSFKETASDRVFFTVNVGAKGKAKVTGTMAAGKKVSFSTQLVFNGKSVIMPVVDYKKLGSAFVLVLGDNTATIAYPASEELPVAIGFPAPELEEPLYFSVSNGIAVELDVNGKKLVSNKIKLVLSYASTTGICKGSYKEAATGKTVTVSGVFVGEDGFLSATPKGSDPMEASISSVKPKDFVPTEDDGCDDCKE